MARTVHVRGFRRKDGSYVKPHTREIRGPSRRSPIPERTIFFPAKRQKYAEIVELSDIKSAKGSVERLMDEFNRAETRAKKRYIKQSTVLAANRAGVMAGNKRLHRSTRQEKAKIESIYRKAASDMVLD